MSGAVPRSRMRVAVVLSAGTAVVACAGAETAPAGFEVTDSAGVVLVRNPAELADSSRTPRLTPDLRIGVVEGAPEYQFTQIFGIAEGSAGEVHVLDFRSYNVRVFDASGRYLRTIGRRGQGPGEIERGVRLRVLPGDTVLVLEGGGFSGWRLHTFAPDGSLVVTHAFAGEGGLVGGSAIAPNGEVLLQAARRGADGNRLTDVLLRVDFRSQAVDTLRELPPAGSETPVVHRGLPAWTVLEDGRIVVGRTDQYRLEYLHPDGSPDRVVTRHVLPRALSESEKAAILEERDRAGIRRLPVPTASGFGQPSAESTVADALPFYGELVAGPRGTLWIRRYPDPEEFAGQSDGIDTWDVLDAEGLLLGSIRMDALYPPPWGAAEHLYRVVRDELNVPYVERLRIDWGGGG